LAAFLIVTWHAGGGVHPALGLARLLVARGHEVRVLAPRLLEAEVEAAGCVWRPFPQEAEFDPAAGRAAGEQRDYMEETFFGTILPEALRAEVRSDPAALVHTLRSFHGDYEIFGTWGRARIDEVRNRLGQDPLENVHMGWITEEPAAATGFELPWDRTDPRALVVVGLSSTYMHQEGLMERILAALSDLPVRVLASTGPELDPSELRAPENIEVRRWLPHSLVLPEAALMATHAGVGSLMAGFAYGVPCVCIPLGRDQPRNAFLRAVLRAGARSQELFMSCCSSSERSSSSAAHRPAMPHRRR
jgi:UDP:flavonoid glycosyltransferase YjiC (YdhE family)